MLTCRTFSRLPVGGGAAGGASAVPNVGEEPRNADKLGGYDGMADSIDWAAGRVAGGDGGDVGVVGPRPPPPPPSWAARSTSIPSRTDVLRSCLSMRRSICDGRGWGTKLGRGWEAARNARPPCRRGSRGGSYNSRHLLPLIRLVDLETRDALTHAGPLQRLG
eukprot:2919615-Prymnesium_polylepis.1